MLSKESPLHQPWTGQVATLIEFTFVILKWAAHEKFQGSF